MRNNILQKLIAVVCLLFSLNAYSFEVDGIYYKILSEEDKTVEVTYRGSIYSEYDEYTGNVVIPAKVNYNENTYSVTSIGEAAFSWCSELISVTISNGTTSIGSHAFHYCSKLNNISIPNSVTSIGSHAFHYCSKLNNT